MKWLVIINPASGGGRTEKKIRYIQKKMGGISADFAITEYAGHAEEIVRNAVGYGGIAVTGGDGTVFNTLKNFNFREQVLAVIPSGTGNCLAKELSIHSLADGIDVLKSGNTVNLDILRLSILDYHQKSIKCFSTVTVGLGYPVDAALTANQKLKFLGRFCYTVASILEAVSNHKKPYTISRNNSPAVKIELRGILINNSKFAGNYTVFPDAYIRDGLFDVMETTAAFFRQIWHNVSVMTKLHFYNPANSYTARNLVISMASPQYLMVDGEVFPDILKVSVEILPGELTVCSRGY